MKIEDALRSMAIQREQARDVLMAKQDDVQFVALLTRKIGGLLGIQSGR